jgi:7,8-dihydropterin-6-yl-methyl-4-(beta-D-ribofuranosyl)aminobenzene 5'-phosphate synthase
MLLTTDGQPGRGLVVFTGCGHAGVVNTVREALRLDGGPVQAVVGGYHLADADSGKVDATVEDLIALDPKILLAGHCTGWRAKFRMEQAMPGRLAPCSVGMMYRITAETLNRSLD